MRSSAVIPVVLLAGFATHNFLTHEPQPRQIAITHVTVIDGTGAPAQAEMTVVIRGDRIAAVGKGGSAPVAADAQVVEGRGR